MKETPKQLQELVLEPVPCAAPFDAWRFPLAKFPLQPSARHELEFLVSRLASGAAHQRGLEPHLWLDTRYLHEDGGSKLFSANARAWSPRMGFCFDPSALPPRKLQMADLMDMEYGTPLELHDRSAIFISRTRQTLPAYCLMVGRGLAVLLFFAQPDPSSGMQDENAAALRYMAHTRDRLRAAMAPGQFQNFDFYLPLLTASGIASATAQQLTTWMGDAELYLHESADTEELVLLSRSDLNPIFRSSGMRPLAHAEGKVPWALSYDPTQEPPHA